MFGLFFFKYNYRAYVLLMLVIHVFASILNYKLNLASKLDSYNFYFKALHAHSIIDLFNPGTRFISFLIYPFVNLGIDYLALSFLFSLIGLVGLFKITKLFFPLDTALKKIGVFIMLFPSLHFWTSGLTKESLLIFFMALILEEIFKNKILSIKIFICLCFILFIRPYLFIIILLGLTVKFLMSENFSVKKTIMSITSLIILSLLSIPIFKFFLNFKSYNIEEIEKLFYKINLYSVETGSSSFSLENTNYFERFFIVLFRPLFFDSTNFYQFIISIENCSVLFFIFFIIYKTTRNKIKVNSNILYLLITSVLVVLFLSIYMYNLGLASRMRVMFLPFLILGMVLMFNVNKSSLNEKEIN